LAKPIISFSSFSRSVCVLDFSGRASWSRIDLRFSLILSLYERHGLPLLLAIFPGLAESVNVGWFLFVHAETVTNELELP
jgi:hypothetical protein